MKFKVKHNGKNVGTIAATSMEHAASVASKRWGPGDYNIKLVREHSDEEE